MSNEDYRFEYRASLDSAGGALAEGGSPLALSKAWTPEHLLLAGLVACSIKSLKYHARRAEIHVTAGGSAHGTVARRAEDGRFAFVEVDVRIEAELDPSPESLGELLAKTERDCFVGASLTVKPSYEWVVNA
ncbi:MAG TPA: OsmC family protein [Gaiellaceae bacterium]|nr:OsmC family protein [Gaiellaceae bacterium]